MELLDPGAPTSSEGTPGRVAAFDCPRCGNPAEGERFYGPCRSCRAELARSSAGVERVVTAERFEPRMHVTPNAVATKE
ncbi:MAG: hypothetical protein M0T80_09320 [Actinomycetota bacterium]|nr:hypothetical protein [Actinomycetota bacterium]